MEGAETAQWFKYRGPWCGAVRGGNSRGGAETQSRRHGAVGVEIIVDSQVVHRAIRLQPIAIEEIEE